MYPKQSLSTGLSCSKLGIWQPYCSDCSNLELLRVLCGRGLWIVFRGLQDHRCRGMWWKWEGWK